MNKGSSSESHCIFWNKGETLSSALRVGERDSDTEFEEREVNERLESLRRIKGSEPELETRLWPSMGDNKDVEGFFEGI